MKCLVPMEYGTVLVDEAGEHAGSVVLLKRS